MGHVNPTRVGLALVPIGAILAGNAPTLIGFGASAVFVGTGQALTQVAVTHAIGHAPGPRGTAYAFSVLALGFSISGFFGPVMTGLLIDHIHHAWTFRVLCVPALLGLVLMARAVRGSPRAAVSPPAIPSGKASASGLLADPEIRVVMIMTGLLVMAWDLFTFLLPLHASRIGLTATEIGIVALGSFCIRRFLGQIAWWLSERRMVVIALVCTCLLYTVMPFTWQFEVLLVLSWLLGVVLGSAQPMAMSLLHHVALTDRTGELIGMRTIIVSMSQTALPLAFGVPGAAFGTAPMFWCAAVVIGGGVASVRYLTTGDRRQK